MIRSEVKALVGRRALVFWRDPTSDAAWTTKPLAAQTTLAETLAFIVGFNARGEVVLASSKNDSGEYGDTTAVPLSCLCEIIPLAPADN